MAPKRRQSPSGIKFHSNNSNSSNYYNNNRTTRAPVIFFAVCGITLTITFTWTICQSSGHIFNKESYNWRMFYTDDDPFLWNWPWNNITNKFITNEELNFPLAYSLLIYTDAKQALMLLRAIYRAHNQYCIHVDAKSPPDLHLLMRHLEIHMKNVFVVRRPIAVIHSQFSTLEADLICMRELLKRDKKWKYFINLTGQEYPRKTNLEMVRILQVMNGSNLMNKMPLDPHRVLKRFLSPMPHNIQLWKGAVHIIAVREFISFALYDERAINLMDFIRDTLIPDESYFSSLNHNHHLQAPGGYQGDELTGPDYPYVNRLKSWSNEPNQKKCNGIYLRLICIWGDEDFATLTDENDPSLFINKFIVNINGVLLKKIDQWFHNRQAKIYSNPQNINLQFYEKMPQRRLHY